MTDLFLAIWGIIAISLYIVIMESAASNAASFKEFLAIVAISLIISALWPLAFTGLLYVWYDDWKWNRKLEEFRKNNK